MILNSPTASQFGEAVGGRLPKQIQRVLPLYLFVFLLILFLSFTDFGSSSSGGADRNLIKARRGSEYQSIAKRDSKYSAALNIGDGFPKKIWQSWKVDPLGFDERDSNTARTWTQKNPGHRYEVLTDNNDLYYVETHFGPTGLNRMDIVEIYRSLTVKIVKADLLRYLVMYVEGGVYADIDVEALRPIDRFIPERYVESEIDMVISVEIDQPEFKDHPILGKKSQSFCQWTFMCKPRLPVMLRLIENIMIWLNSVAKQQNVPISQIHLDFDEVISGTGPSAFTTAVLAEMSIVEKKAVSWDQFHAMRESKLVGGVLVLTVEAFAAGQGHSDSGNHNSRTALVKHHYHASGWPTAHPRYRHPVYSEVERCNWEFDCVRRWDEHIGAYDKLSELQQRQLVELKESSEQIQAQREAFLALSPEDQAKIAALDELKKANVPETLEPAPENVPEVAAAVVPPPGAQPAPVVAPLAQAPGVPAAAAPPVAGQPKEPVQPAAVVPAVPLPVAQGPAPQAPAAQVPIAQAPAAQDPAAQVPAAAQPVAPAAAANPVPLANKAPPIAPVVAVAPDTKEPDAAKAPASAPEGRKSANTESEDASAEALLPTENTDESGMPEIPDTVVSSDGADAHAVRGQVVLGKRG